MDEGAQTPRAGEVMAVAWFTGEMRCEAAHRPCSRGH